MGILMYRGLARSYTWVDVYLAAYSEAVSLTIRRAEEAHLIRYLQVLVVEDDIVPVILITGIVRVVGGMHLDTRVAEVVKEL